MNEQASYRRVVRVAEDGLGVAHFVYPADKVEGWVEYNRLHRSHSALFVDGKCVCPGSLDPEKVTACERVLAAEWSEPDEADYRVSLAIERGVPGAPYVRAVRVYNDGTRHSVVLKANEIDEWTRYNRTMRFGCALFIDGRCLADGYLGRERCQEVGLALRLAARTPPSEREYLESVRAEQATELRRRRSAL